MRLTKQQVDGIIQSVGKFIQTTAKLYLYGSRTKDELKGGDIDLLLIVPDKNNLATIKSNKHRIISEIHGLIGEQKIDLKMALDVEGGHDPFLNQVFAEAIQLFEWASPPK